MLLRSDPPSSGYSPASPTPQLQPSPSPLLPSLSPLPTSPFPTPSSSRFNRSFAWNPLGDSMRLQHYPFAMLLVAADDSSILSLAQANEAAVAAGSQPLYHAEFRNPSYATGNSLECLEEGDCNPVGAQSVWATLFPLDAGNGTKREEVVMAVTGIDSQSLFDKTSTGAEGGMSGAIVLLAAAHALGVLWESNATAAALTSLQRNVLFFFPHAESFDHAGSRRLVDDLLHFDCEWEVVDDDGQPSCLAPWTASYDFLQLRRNTSDAATALGRIARILEVGQVGLNSSFFAHVERDANPQRDAWVAQLMQLARFTTPNSTTPPIITLDHPAPDTPGIPPAASEAFLTVNASIPTVVLTDHRREFINRFYHSQFDVGRTNLLHADGATDTSPTMCALATLVARGLFVAAGGNESYVGAIAADCRLVVSLLLCLTVDSGCAELTQGGYRRQCGPWDAVAPARPVVPQPPTWHVLLGR